jgi:hypothetical protein
VLGNAGWEGDIQGFVVRLKRCWTWGGGVWIEECFPHIWKVEGETGGPNRRRQPGMCMNH